MNTQTELTALRAMYMLHQLSMSEFNQLNHILSSVLLDAYQHDDSSLWEDLQILSELVDKFRDHHFSKIRKIGDRIDSLTDKDGLL